MSIVLDFEFERETKNTVRFKEIADEDAGEAVGTMYISKAALANAGMRSGSGTPLKLRIAIEAV